MTTYSPADAVIDHTSDAGFRAWGLEFHNLLANAGLTQTADTGQINWTTVTRAAITNNSAGYEIWRFNDTLQSTAPIFFKVEFGTSNIATSPQSWLTVGTGSNGSGTITGIFYARTAMQASGAANVISSTVLNFLSQACYNTTYGAFFICFKIAAMVGGPTYCAFAVCRTVDSAGAPTATGAIVYSMFLNVSSTFTVTNTQMNFVTGYNVTSSGATGVAGCEVPFALSSTIIVGRAQVFRYYQVMPDILPMSVFLAVVANEIPVNTQFQASPNGASITYLVLNVGAVVTAENTGIYRLAVIWQ